MVARPSPPAWLTELDRERCPLCDALAARLSLRDRGVAANAALELLLRQRADEIVEAGLRGLSAVLPDAHISVLAPHGVREWNVLRSSAPEGSGDQLVATELYPELVEARSSARPRASAGLARRFPLDDLLLPLGDEAGPVPVAVFPLFVAPGTAEPVLLRIALPTRGRTRRLTTVALLGHLLVHRLAQRPADIVARELDVPSHAPSPADPTRLLRYLPMPTCLVDSRGRLIHANDPAARLLGLDQAGLGGVRLSTRLRAPWRTSPPFWEGTVTVPGNTVAVVGWSGPTVEGRWLVLFDAHPEARRRRRESRIRGALADKVQELEAVNARLEHFATLSARFVSDAAHELKTPLAILSSYLETLSTDLAEGLTGEQREFVVAASDGARRLQHLVEGLLDLAALESGGAPLDLGPVEVTELFSAAIRELRPLARRAGIALRVAATTTAPFRADAERLARVVRNLVENAIKYGRPGGTVGLGSRASEDRGVLVVEDDGPGIPAEVLPTIFDEFTRGPRIRPVQGSGLGLAIARRLVGAMGGRIWAESTPGLGSRFTVELPLWAGPA